jgi:hypothetical protein
MRWKNNMMKPQKVLSGGERVWFRKGKFDHFYVVVTDKDNKVIYAPKDCMMFDDLLVASGKFGKEIIWNFILGMATGINRYSRVSDYTIPLVFKEFEVLFYYIIAAMIAEENMATAVLGKRVKLLGTYQVLIEGMETELAANFSKGKPWRELDEECRKRGF